MINDEFVNELDDAAEEIYSLPDASGNDFEVKDKYFTQIMMAQNKTVQQVADYAHNAILEHPEDREQIIKALENSTVSIPAQIIHTVGGKDYKYDWATQTVSVENMISKDGVMTKEVAEADLNNKLQKAKIEEVAEKHQADAVVEQIDAIKDGNKEKEMDAAMDLAEYKMAKNQKLIEVENSYKQALQTYTGAYRNMLPEDLRRRIEQGKAYMEALKNRRKVEEDKLADALEYNRLDVEHLSDKASSLGASKEEVERRNAKGIFSIFRNPQRMTDKEWYGEKKKIEDDREALLVNVERMIADAERNIREYDRRYRAAAMTLDALKKEMALIEKAKTKPIERVDVRDEIEKASKEINEAKTLTYTDILYADMIFKVVSTPEYQRGEIDGVFDSWFTDPETGMRSSAKLNVREFLKQNPDYDYEKIHEISVREGAILGDIEYADESEKTAGIAWMDNPEAWRKLEKERAEREKEEKSDTEFSYDSQGSVTPAEPYTYQDVRPIEVDAPEEEKTSEKSNKKVTFKVVMDKIGNYGGKVRKELTNINSKLMTEMAAQL